mmetsp:Transcript_66097/g.158110  ORF Transcript_66097/g.158110 Transcript_66097/m.158110 type:complete len:461 (-) Transcript_66097:154-1536(-)
MPTASRPTILTHLRELLVEKEEAIELLQKRLRSAEDSSARLDRLEAALGVAAPSANVAARPSDDRIDALIALAMERHGTPAADAAIIKENGHVLKGELNGKSEAAPTELREQLQLANSRCMELASESARRVAESETLRQEVESLRARVATAEAEAAAQAPLRRELETLRSRLKTAVQEASVLRSQLASRDADIVRLERSVAELEGWAPHLGGRRQDEVGRLPVKVYDDAYRQVYRGSSMPGATTSVVSTATGCEGMSTASSMQYSSVAPGGILYGTTERSSPACAGRTPVTVAAGSVRGGDAVVAVAHAVSARTRSPVRPAPQLSTSPVSVVPMVGTPPAVHSGQQSSIRSVGDAPTRWGEPKTPPHAILTDGSRTTTIVHRSQSVPVPVRHASPGPVRLSGQPSVSLARWAASPGSSRRSEGGGPEWISAGTVSRSSGDAAARAMSQPPPPVSVPAFTA